MAKPKDRDTAQLGIWVRRDLWDKVDKWHHDHYLSSKTKAVEILLAWAVENPPPADWRPDPK